MLSPLCGISASANMSSSNESMTTLSAIDIIRALITAKYPVFSEVSYDEKTDPNKLLGRPNQYTSKANASDLRISNKASKNPEDIIVEVFSTVEDCALREKHVQSMYESVPALAQYMYPCANVLLRVDFSLLPSEAEEYNGALKIIVAGGSIPAFKALPTSTEVLSVDVSTRENPALVGDRVIAVMNDNKIALTVMYSYRGKSSALFTKSFNKYNNSKMILPKGKEWALVYLKIESMKEDKYPIDLSDYYFHIVAENGVDKGYSPMQDNPNSINSMYADGVQYCWFGIPVVKNEKLYLTFSNGNSDSYWFDLSNRRIVDTASLIYPDIIKKDSGETVEAMQMMLVEYGYLTKIPSGVFDSNTLSALKKFQKAVGLKADGAATQETLRRLFSGQLVEAKH